MTDDDPTAQQPRDPSERPPGSESRPAGPPDGSARPVEPPAAPEPDPMAALERLQSLGGAPGGASPRQGDRAAAPDRERKPRLRPAAVGSQLTPARIAAPAVFLVAVIVLISIMVQSGVIGGKDEARVTQPKPAVTKTKGASAKPTKSPSSTKTYVVKAGDTPSGIAHKYAISVTELEQLNPGKDFTTLVIGEKLKVPKK